VRPLHRDDEVPCLVDRRPVGRRASDRRPTAELGTVSTHVLTGDEPLRYLVFVPHGCEPKRLAVAVHGISRRARDQIEAFAPAACQAESVVAAPIFEPPAYNRYQRFGWNSRAERADLVMHRLIEKVGNETAVPSGRVSLFGFSGGGQFAHRYAMAYPERVAACAVASAGWYTFPDESRAFPYGLGDDGRGSADAFRFDPERFLRVPMLVLVGEQDLERDASFRTSRRLDRQQGRTRVDRALNFVNSMRGRADELGIAAQLEMTVVPGVAHHFRESAKAGIAERVFRFLYGNSITRRSQDGDRCDWDNES